MFACSDCSFRSLRSSISSRVHSAHFRTCRYFGSERSSFSGVYTQVFSVAWSIQPMRSGLGIFFEDVLLKLLKEQRIVVDHPGETTDARPRNPSRSPEVPVPEFTAEHPEFPIFVGYGRDTSCISFVSLLGSSPFWPPRRSRTLSCRTASSALRALWVGHLQEFFPRRSLRLRGNVRIRT